MSSSLSARVDIPAPAPRAAAETVRPPGRGGPAAIVVAAGSGRIDQLWRALTPAERSDAGRHATNYRRNQFALGRLCARAALRELIGTVDDPPQIEVRTGPRGEPRASFNGDRSSFSFSLSLSHSGSLAAACAWSVPPGVSFAGGIDLERVRDSELASNDYAFSAHERSLIAGARANLTGLAAWAVKEAAWKTLTPDPGVGPEALEISRWDLAGGFGVVRVFGRLLASSINPIIRVWFGLLDGPDGDYVLALAESGPRCLSIKRSPEGAKSTLPSIRHWSLACNFKTIVIAAPS